MWEVKEAEVKLPEGFLLKEDEDFVYLFQGDKKVATFPATINPEEITKQAERRMRDDKETTS